MRLGAGACALPDFQRNLTLQEVAAGAGLSKGFLSQFERGGAAASIGSLVRICSVLGIKLSSLFDLPDVVGPSIVRRQHASDASFRQWRARACHHSARGTPCWESAKYSSDREGKSGDEPAAHGGDVAVVIVLRGTLEMSLSGESVVFAPAIPSRSTQLRRTPFAIGPSDEQHRPSSSMYPPCHRWRANWAPSEIPTSTS